MKPLLPPSLRPAVAGLLLSLPATAATTYLAPASYDASAAGGHVLWLPAVGFTSNTADGVIFTENADGTASLAGAARSGANGFDFTIMFAGRSATPPAGQAPGWESPKNEGYGGDGRMETWWYYTSTTGTLTGVGSFAGRTLTVERMGPSFQVGDGASGKNVDFGASGWLIVKEGGNALSGHGDMNVNLLSRSDGGREVADGGTTLVLLGSAISGLALLRRRLAR